MKIEIDLSPSELQTLLAQRGLCPLKFDKDALRTEPSPCLEKSLESNVLHRYSEHHIERLADNTLVCTGCGIVLPATPQGDVDVEQLMREMLSHLWQDF